MSLHNFKKLVIFNMVKMIISLNLTVLLTTEVVIFYEIEVLVNRSREPTGENELRAFESLFFASLAR
jgi:hypothetical protein